MNKRLLSVISVALLGVGAAFATSTSTVYFSASGSLNKAEEPSIGVYSIQNGNYFDVNGHVEHPTINFLEEGKVKNTNSNYNESDYLYKKINISDLNLYSDIPICEFIFYVDILNNEDKTYFLTLDTICEYNAIEINNNTKEVINEKNVTVAFKTIKYENFILFIGEKYNVENDYDAFSSYLPNLAVNTDLTTLFNANKDYGVKYSLNRMYSDNSGKYKISIQNNFITTIFINFLYKRDNGNCPDISSTEEFSFDFELPFYSIN